jgi:hypothetical protein
MLNSYCTVVAEYNSIVEAFNYKTFKGLLLRFFIIEQIALIKVELQALRNLLIYCNLCYKAVLLRRTTLKRYISSAYD